MNLPALQDQLRRLLGSIHSWKILLDVPVYAVEWELGPESPVQTKLAYQTALSRALRRGARLKRGEQGELHYSYQSRGLRHELYLPHHAALAQLCALINRANLAGVVLDWLGMEDPPLVGDSARPLPHRCFEYFQAIEHVLRAALIDIKESWWAKLATG